MRVHITNMNGQASTAQVAQNMVAKIAREQLGFTEMGIYSYNVASDGPDKLSGRLDGIIAGLSVDDVVILQSPTWNGARFEHLLLDRIKAYRNVKVIVFIHDVVPWMNADAAGELTNYIKLYNRCDLVISPNQKMTNRLRECGLMVTKVINQEFWDHPVAVDSTKVAPFAKRVTFIGLGSTKPLIENWDSEQVKLVLTADKQSMAADKNIEFMGYQYDYNLLGRLRQQGGFGLLWNALPIWREYMQYNTSYKLSTYLAAGLPVITSPNIAQREVIEAKKLGLFVNSVDEAVRQIENMTSAEYQEMRAGVEGFAHLIRNGYFTKRILTEAIFNLFY
ncbi:sugar transferase [Ligilactobacillus agilis]|uniref:sugar transferase n=1 Tax=Ligilactobacillus agilis TaxID=1601 RepID=UPI0014381A3A|nr:sugar transferase [Ligilactobacillus agilis]GET09513.1 hypothetical protein SN10121_00030 [Ligilactobacillus agilis]